MFVQLVQLIVHTNIRTKHNKWIILFKRNSKKSEPLDSIYMFKTIK